MKYFPFFFGSFIVPLKHNDNTEFGYFNNVPLVVIISIVPPIFNSIISVSFNFSFFNFNIFLVSSFLFLYCFENSF